MEGFWGMGTTVSSYSSARRLEVGSPSGGRRGGPGAPGYGDGAFTDQLRAYHMAAAWAHREHSHPDIPLPIPVPAYAGRLVAGRVATANRTDPADGPVPADGQS